MAQATAADAQTAIPGTERPRGRIVHDSELKAMQDTCRMLDALPEDSRARVLGYLGQRYQGVDFHSRIVRLESRLDEMDRKVG